jgi:hypothetical protein
MFRIAPYFYLFIAVVLFQSCADDPNYYELERKDFIFVNSILNPNSDISVSIKENKAPSLELNPVNDAIVKIISLNSAMEFSLALDQEGMYKLDAVKPKTGEVYTLNIIKDNSVLEAETIIPSPPAISSLSYNLTPNQQFYEVSLELAHKANRDEFYYIESISEYITDNFTSYTNNLILLPTGPNEFIIDYFNSTDNQSTYERLYFHIPAEVDQTRIRIDFFVEENPNAKVTGMETELFDQTFTLKALTEELFNFQSTSIQSQSILFTAESQPLPIQSNISEGQGIFGGSNDTTLVLVR